MPAYVKVSGAWKQATTAPACYVKVSGAWKKCSQVYVKVNGAWKPCYATAVAKTMDVTVGSVMTLSNVSSGSTVKMTLYQCYGGSINYGSGDGGMDTIEEYGFSCAIKVTGGKVTAAVENYDGRISNCYFGYISSTDRWYIDQGGSWARCGDITIDITSTAATVKIEIVSVSTGFRSGKIAYTATS